MFKNMKKNKLFFLMILSPLFGYEFIFDYSESYNFKNEIEVINSLEIDNTLYLFPHLGSKQNNYHSIFEFDDLEINPVFAVRFSNASFEIFPEYSNSDLFWISPGIQMDFKKTIGVPFSNINITFQGWGRFHKHSAYGFDDNYAPKNLLMFPYNPDNSFEFYTNTREPKNGIDFDEAEGAFAVITPWADILIGKFRSRLGPFTSGNLSLSNQSPGFAQTQVRLKLQKLNVILTAGDLNSEMFQYVGYEDNDLSNDIPNSALVQRIPRYVVNHRLDYNINENFRIGLYEQVIIGHSLSLLYLVPTMPFWSAQHSLGDTDNLQMGFDLDYLHNNSRYYAAFIIDEWAPYSTFKSNHHNWFGIQAGFSRLLYDKFLFKMEYSKIEPQVYTHNHPINEPFHNGYPIGFWSRGDSEDILLNIFFEGQNDLNIIFEVQHTVMGNPEYVEGLNFLESENLKKRINYSLKFDKKIKSSIGPLNYIFNLKKIESVELYDNPSFIDCQIAVLYNISY
ncbi:MAG: hypothetical protein CMG00_01440 [Candidatus Marinimicrobia bacterium]|nr:hypothetical protein [Candidatus Neomarinimicrobiota bacterium]|tara:strand:- start:2918 stop:4438 length:1521 start_codon:yes stop_codon:yes gene_type:complete